MRLTIDIDPLDFDELDAGEIKLILEKLAGRVARRIQNATHTRNKMPIRDRRGDLIGWARFELAEV